VRTNFHAAFYILGCLQNQNRSVRLFVSLLKVFLGLSLELRIDYSPPNSYKNWQHPTSALRLQALQNATCFWQMIPPDERSSGTLLNVSKTRIFIPANLSLM
jgi:hypothetical protein